MKSSFHAMQVPPKSSFLARVHDAMTSLHPSERRLADTILNFPGQIASYNASELARIAGVSNATVTRFVRKIGYPSFEEARQAVRGEQNAGAALFRVGREGVQLQGGVARHLEQSRLNLEQTLFGVTEQMLDDLASSMIAARRLWLIGHRAGQPFARYLGWQVLQVRSDVTVLPRDGETLAESLSGIDRPDCVVLFMLRRPPRVMQALPQLLARSGAPLALIGDLPGLETLPAQWHLPCRTAAPGPLFNHVAVMALCNLLASRAIDLAGPEGRRRLSAIEDMHDSLDEL